MLLEYDSRLEVARWPGLGYGGKRFPFYFPIVVNHFSGYLR